MSDVWIYSLLSVAIVSAVSLVGVITLGLNHDRLKSILFYLVSFSAGALLGDVFLHVIPELGEESGFGVREGIYFLLGIVVFFVLERFIHWQHSHGDEHDERVHSAVYLTIFGDSLHNFIDGMVIAASFLASPTVGIASTIAVILHEIPQEIGQYAILIHGGWGKTKALWYNFLSALTSVIGAVIVLIFAKDLDGAPPFLLAFAGASFIYIALSDLVPELHKEESTKRSIVQFFCFAIGIALMAALLVLE
jgi:zinc and cadmium transporter